MKNVLVLSGTASAINYVKSFVPDPDVRLHVTDISPYCPSFYMAGVTPHWVPLARDTARYRATLTRILREHTIDVLIPTSDYDVEAVVQYLHDGWVPQVAMFHPPFHAFRILGNKKRLMQHLSERMPIVVPRTRDATEAIDQLAYPLVIKPTTESGGKGVIIVRDATQLAAGIARARADYDDQFVIQEFIPGSTYIVSMVYDQKGRLVIAAGMRSFVTFFTWGGGGWAAEMVDEPELLRLCADVVAAVGGWCGPINLEWRRHSETGAFFLLEANCRLNGYSYLTTMNGVPLPRIVLALLTGQKLPEVSHPSERTRHRMAFREAIHLSCPHACKKESFRRTRNVGLKPQGCA